MKTSVRGFAALGAAAIAVTALVSCSSDTDTSTTAQGTDGFPVGIENTFGTTTIESKPERLVTLGWNAQDILYALDLTPVGQPKYTYGADDNGVMPWAQDYFDADKTTLFDMPASGEPPIESIASLTPDVILAPYEGFEESVYNQLSKIAPTAAYPGAAWQTSWQDQTRIVGKAVGKSDEAEQARRRPRRYSRRYRRSPPGVRGEDVGSGQLRHRLEQHQRLPAHRSARPGADRTRVRQRTRRREARRGQRRRIVLQDDLLREHRRHRRRCDRRLHRRFR
nr:ABC transporter substrate-binding protein [Rhodococcus erythropolis]